MKKIILAALCAALTAIAPSVWAVGTTVYDVPITFIAGNGNPNTGFTVNTAGDIQLGLRAKGRNDSAYASLTPNNAAGTYTFATFSGARGPFNYEFSINSDTSDPASPLSTYDFYISVDGDPSAGIIYTTVNPLAHWFDNSFGGNGTANGAGVEPAIPADYLAFPGLYNIAQNSQNITFGDYPGGGFAVPGPTDATYDYELFAVAHGAGSGATRLADVGITVVVGHGRSGHLSSRRRINHPHAQRQPYLSLGFNPKETIPFGEFINLSDCNHKWPVCASERAISFLAGRLVRSCLLAQTGNLYFQKSTIH